METSLSDVVPWTTEVQRIPSKWACHDDDGDDDDDDDDDDISPHF